MQKKKKSTINKNSKILNRDRSNPAWPGPASQSPSGSSSEFPGSMVQPFLASCLFPYLNILYLDPSYEVSVPCPKWGLGLRQEMSPTQPSPIGTAKADKEPIDRKLCLHLDPGNLGK